MLCKAALEHKAVGNDKRSLLAHYILKLLKSDRQTTFLDINLFGRTEPQHILSPLGNGLDI